MSQTEVMSEVDIPWEMTREELSFLFDLPTTVELWYAHGEEGTGTFYLTREAGFDGMAAYAHSTATSQIEARAVCARRIVAVDLERQTAQVATDD